MKPVILSYARLARPANLPTAAADILAGIAIAGAIPQTPDYLPLEISFNLLFLVLASVLLYAGGVVLNDVFDVGIDKVERPERPIPSGLISKISAAIFGVLLLVCGSVAGFLCNTLSGAICLVLATSIVLYDAVSKNYDFAGPLNMGICRGLNLILGMSVLGEINHIWYAVIPVVYIFAITLISRGEVHGRNKGHIIWAGLLYALVILAVLTSVLAKSANIYQVVPFLLFFSIMKFRPLLNAYKINSPDNIRKAVIGGVISLIILDASLAVVFSAWWYGLLIILLLPLSILLSRVFAVT